MDMEEYISHGVPVTWAHVQTEADSKLLDRPCGQYITLETGALDKLNSFEAVCACLADQLRPLLEPWEDTVRLRPGQPGYGFRFPGAGSSQTIPPKIIRIICCKVQFREGSHDLPRCEWVYQFVLGKNNCQRCVSYRCRLHIGRGLHFLYGS